MRRGLVGLGGEAGGLVEEPVEVGAPDPRAVGAGGDLDVDADDALDVGDQFGQRGGEPPRSRRSLGRSGPSRR